MSSPAGGTILAGKYRLEKPLNAGGMGSVWVARHLELDVEVAVKLISWVQALKPVMVERFKREARAAAQLRSPHVVQILDYGVHDGVPYMAMELLAGEDLSDHLAARGRLTPKRALEILRPVGKVLGLAHQTGIVHRDVKPANIFLARVGEDEVVKVLDFGIAKETSREAQHTTGTGLVGSPLYMSPEQMKGSDVDAQSDLWSLAVVLYEALAGEPPFDAAALPQLFQLVSTTDASPPSTKLPELSAFDEFFRRGLARDKTARFVSARELVAAFEEAAAHAPEVTIAPLVRPAVARSAAGTEALAPTAELTRAHPAPQTRESAKAETLDALADLPSSSELARPNAKGGGKRAGLLVGAGLGAAALLAAAAWLSSTSSFRSASSSPTGASAGPEPTASAATSPAVGATTLVQPEAQVSAPPSAAPSPAASASAAPVVAAGPAGSPLRPQPPRPVETSKPTGGTTPPPPPATDPIWGVPVSQPKR